MTHTEALDVINFLTRKGFRIAAIVQLLRDRDTRNWSYHKDNNYEKQIFSIRCNGVEVWKDTRDAKRVPIIVPHSTSY